jgi:predicted MFS family arabinose efflux permease
MIDRAFRQWWASYSGLSREIWLLAAVNLINRMGGMVVVFLSVYLTDKNHLNFSLEYAGYALMCAGAGGIVGAMVGGWLSDRIGYFNVQLISLIINGILLIILLHITDFWQICGVLFVLNSISEAFRPANQLAMSAYSTPETRTRSIAVMRLAYNLGFTIAPALGGIIAYNLGWIWLFWIDGITCLMAAVALSIWLSPKKMPEHVQNAAAPNTTDPKLSPWRNGQFLLFVLYTFFGAMAFMQLMWAAPVFFRDGYGWTENQIGWAMAINGAIVIIVEMPLLYRIEKRYKPLGFVQLGLMLYVAAYAALIGPFWGFWAMVLFMIFISFGEIFVMPFSSNYVLGIVSDRPNRGSYLSVYNLSYQISNVIAPFIATQIAARINYDTLWLVNIGFAAAAFFGFRQLAASEMPKNP